MMAQELEPIPDGPEFEKSLVRSSRTCLLSPIDEVWPANLTHLLSAAVIASLFDLNQLRPSFRDVFD